MMPWQDAPPGRAWEPYQKQQVIDRLMALWEREPKLRLGQLIGNVYYSTDLGGTQQYHVEDFNFIERLEQYYANMDKGNASPVS